MRSIVSASRGKGDGKCLSLATTPLSLPSVSRPVQIEILFMKTSAKVIDEGSRYAGGVDRTRKDVAIVFAK